MSKSIWVVEREVDGTTFLVHAYSNLEKATEHFTKLQNEVYNTIQTSNVEILINEVSFD